MVKLSNNAYVQMGWKYVCYAGNGKKYMFIIEPMMNGKDIVYCPKNDKKLANMINVIKSIQWNRTLEYIDSNYDVKVIEEAAQEYEKGTLESTQAGKEFTQLNMFDPGFDLPEMKVHELWCVLEKRFAEQVEGKVTIKASNVVKDSVFDKITIPTLSKNLKAVIMFT